MILSFIIPTLDEEKRISRVIQQFDKIKGLCKYEVIVGDGGSRDATVKIAKNLGARVFQNDRSNQNIAKNRNLGAEHAKGDILVFCDADTLIENLPRFVKRVEKVFHNQKIVAGMPQIGVFREEVKNKDKVYHYVQNGLIKSSFSSKKAFSSGQCQIVRKSAFDKIKGYNEEVVHGEDSILFQDLQKVGKLYYFSDLLVLESPRRYRKWGYAKLIFTGTMSMASHLIFKKNLLKQWKRVD